MSDTRMSAAEREQFLADLHVGVLAIPNPAGAPLTAPLWYAYEPGGELWFLIGPESAKARLLAVGTRVTLVAQREPLPYAYVSVEATVRAIRPADTEADSRPMARRYLGERMGDGYVAANAGSPSLRVSLQVDRWLTVDYGKTPL